MTLLCFSLFDTKASCFTQPFFFSTRGAAIRAVMDLASDLNTLVGRHPADFHLHLIGEWSDHNAAFLSTGTENLGPVLTFLPVQQPLNLGA